MDAITEEDLAAPHHDDPHWEERCDLAAAFRWAERYDMHEGGANHFILAVSDDGKKFLCNPNQRHFSRVCASELLLLDADDPDVLKGPNAPDPTTWGLHGALHRRVPHAKCALHVHSKYATVLACREDPVLPPLDQNACAFFDRQIVDRDYGGLAFDEEGERCAAMFSDPRKKVMIMGNHGIMVIGETVGDAFNRLYLFERACQTYITALSTGRAIKVLSGKIAEKVAQEIEGYPVSHDMHLAELRLILDEEGSDYAE